MTLNEVLDQLTALRDHNQSLFEKENLPNWKDRWERNLDALNAAIIAVNKQVAKKPIKVAKPKFRYTDGYRCPACGGEFTGTGIADYCYHCGQKLDWEDAPV